jgi:hypothetical protein
MVTTADNTTGQPIRRRDEHHTFDVCEKPSDTVRLKALQIMFPGREHVSDIDLVHLLMIARLLLLVQGQSQKVVTHLL